MAKKPEQRFQTPADLIAELSFLFGAWPSPAAAPHTPVPVGGKGEAVAPAAPGNERRAPASVDVEPLPLTSWMHPSPVLGGGPDTGNTRLLPDVAGDTDRQAVACAPEPEARPETSPTEMHADEAAPEVSSNS